jgi:excisionase family DNA binding protein
VSEKGDFYTAAEAAKVLRISKRRVLQMLGDGELEGEQDASDRWRVPMRAVHAKLEARRDREIPSEAAQSSSEAREWIDRVNILERELGRLEGRLELEAVTRSTLEETLQRERERADRLEEELREERGKGFWRRMFGG